MDRRALSLGIASSLVAIGRARAATNPTRTWRVGFVGVGPGGFSDWKYFSDELARRGIVEGREFNWVGQDITELRQLDAAASDLVKANVDVIVINFREGINPAKRATKTIPIVMLMASDAVQEGWVTSLAHPGGNLTGISGFPSEMEVKRLQILMETLGRPQRISYLVFEPFRNRPVVVEQISLLTAAANANGAELQVVGVGEAHGLLDAAVERVARARADGVLIHNHATAGAASHAEVGELMLKHRLPSIMSFRAYAAGGVLFTFSEDSPEMYRKGAVYVARLMAGAKPSELPIELPTRFEFVINLKTAAALGLKIPQPVLLRADELIR